MHVDFSQFKAVCSVCFFFAGRTSPKTLLTFCTNGVLLRTLMGGDNSMDTVTHVIIVSTLVKKMYHIYWQNNDSTKKNAKNADPPASWFTFISIQIEMYCLGAYYQSSWKLFPVCGQNVWRVFNALSHILISCQIFFSVDNWQILNPAGQNVRQGQSPCRTSAELCQSCRACPA